jgi:bifunctional non-homologous end joining protein LigD
VVFFAFDLLRLNGDDLRKLPLVERRERLEKLLGARDPKSPLQFSEAVGGSGAEVSNAADQLGLEGIVSKQKASRYESGTSQWLKTKCTVENDFVVVGVEPNPGGPPFALLAREEGGQLVYAGSAFVTLPAKARDRFWERAEALKIDRPAVAEIKRRKVGFVKPTIRVRARHLRGETMLRHASLTALLTT